MSICQKSSVQRQQHLGESSQNEKQPQVEKMGNWEVAQENQIKGNKFRSLTGNKFGKLLVVALSTHRDLKKNCYWICRCECGTLCLACSERLISNQKKSCGCLVKETSARLVRSMNTTHGDARNGKISTEHKAWTSMRQRCNCQTHKFYLRYGGRGITICERWSKFENFLSDMGRKPSPHLTLDRIDNEGNYEPNNCRWASYSQQQNNRSSNRVFEFNGTSKTLKQWCVQFGINPVTASDRIKRGWTFARAMTQPVNKLRTSKLKRVNEIAAQLRELRYNSSQP